MTTRFVVGSIDVEWFNVASSDNAADLVTRMSTTSEILQEGSSWFTGPDYLQLSVDHWPIDRNFADRKRAVKLPLEEVRKQYV